MRFRSMGKGNTIIDVLDNSISFSSYDIYLLSPLPFCVFLPSYFSLLVLPYFTSVHTNQRQFKYLPISIRTSNQISRDPKMSTSCAYYLAYCPIIMVSSMYKKIHRSLCSSSTSTASRKSSCSSSEEKEKPRKMKLRAVNDYEEC